MASDTLGELLSAFHNFTKKPTDFLSVQEEIKDDVKHFIKSMYDFTKLQEQDGKEVKKNESALPELIVEDFDEEQIWQEIELQNTSLLDDLISNVASSVINKSKLLFPVEEKIKEFNQDEEVDDVYVKNDEPGETGDEDDEMEKEFSEKPKKKNGNKEMTKSASQKNIKSSIVDDEFFKLNEMERFLEDEDRKEMLQGKRKKKDDIEEDSIDLFQEDDSDVDDEDDENNEESGIKYNDFFDCPNDEPNKQNESQSDYENDSDDHDSEDIGSDKDETKQSANKKSVRFNLGDSESDDNDSEVEPTKLNTEKNNDKQTKLSDYELRQKRLRERIAKLEDKNLGDKPWQLKGEVDAISRPQNSLLEEVVDFDLTTRPVPIITEETTLKLEDIIKQRIKDKVWDDVERKAKPVPETHEFRKRLILDQEKSKASLAQVYEQEYLKQREVNGDDNAVPEEPEEHKEIKKAMENLFVKLDALSNYHYTPKAAQAEVKIVSNIPAISMEEVAPVATSDAALLAPEEVKGKRKGELMSKSERTATDKKRERRKKKKLQREREKEKEKKEKLINKLKPGLGNKYSKEKAAKLLDKVTTDFKNTDKMTQLNDVNALKSSKAFFTQLNEDMDSSIKTKSKKSKNVLPAKKYKL